MPNFGQVGAIGYTFIGFMLLLRSIVAAIIAQRPAMQGGDCTKIKIRIEFMDIDETALRKQQIILKTNTVLFSLFPLCRPARVNIWRRASLLR